MYDSSIYKLDTFLPDNTFASPTSSMLDEYISEFADVKIPGATFPKRKATEGSRPVLNAILSGVKTGAITGVSAGLDRMFPGASRTLSDVKDFISATVDVNSEASKKLAPEMIKYRKLLEQAYRTGGKYLPPELSRKLEIALKGWEDAAKESELYAGTDPETRRNTIISSAITHALGSQIQLTSALADEDRAHRNLDKLTASMRFEREFTISQSIDRTLLSIDSFNRKIHVEFLKKQLELQYKHLFVAQDSLSLLKLLVPVVENKLAELVHNSSIPDYQKSRPVEYGKHQKHMERWSGIGKAMYTLPYTIGENIASRIAEKSQMIRAVGEGGVSAGGAVHQDIMADMGYDKYAASTDDGHVAAMRKKMARGAIKGVSAVGAGLAANKITGGIARWLSPNAERLDDRLVGLRQEGEDYISDNIRTVASGPGILGSMARLAKFKEQDIKVGDVESDTRAAAFDYASRRSLVEVIPGFLARILQVQESAMTGTDSELMTFNPVSGRIERVSHTRKDVFDKLYGKGGERFKGEERIAGSLYGKSQEYREKKGMPDIPGSVPKEKLRYDNVDEDVITFFTGMSLDKKRFSFNEVLRHLSGEDTTYYADTLDRVPEDRRMALLSYLRETLTTDDGEPDYKLISTINVNLSNANRDRRISKHLNDLTTSYGMQDVLPDIVDKNKKIRIADTVETMQSSLTKEEKDEVQKRVEANAERQTLIEEYEAERSRELYEKSQRNWLTRTFQKGTDAVDEKFDAFQEAADIKRGEVGRRVTRAGVKDAYYGYSDRPATGIGSVGAREPQSTSDPAPLRNPADEGWSQKVQLDQLAIQTKIYELLLDRLLPPQQPLHPNPIPPGHSPVTTGPVTLLPRPGTYASITPIPENHPPVSSPPRQRDELPPSRMTEYPPGIFKQDVSSPEVTRAMIAAMPRGPNASNPYSGPDFMLSAPKRKAIGLLPPHMSATPPPIPKQYGDNLDDWEMPGTVAAAALVKYAEREDTPVHTELVAIRELFEEKFDKMDKFLEQEVDKFDFHDKDKSGFRDNSYQEMMSRQKQLNGKETKLLSSGALPPPIPGSDSKGFVETAIDSGVEKVSQQAMGYLTGALGVKATGAVGGVLTKLGVTAGAKGLLASSVAVAVPVAGVAIAALLGGAAGYAIYQKFFKPWWDKENKADDEKRAALKKENEEKLAASGLDINVKAIKKKQEEVTEAGFVDFKDMETQVGSGDFDMNSLSDKDAWSLLSVVRERTKRLVATNYTLLYESYMDGFGKGIIGKLQSAGMVGKVIASANPIFLLAHNPKKSNVNRTHVNENAVAIWKKLEPEFALWEKLAIRCNSKKDLSLINKLRKVPTFQQWSDKSAKSDYEDYMEDMNKFDDMDFSSLSDNSQAAGLRQIRIKTQQSAKTLMEDLKEQLLGIANSNASPQSKIKSMDDVMKAFTTAWRANVSKSAITWQKMALATSNKKEAKLAEGLQEPPSYDAIVKSSGATKPEEIIDPANIEKGFDVYTAKTEKEFDKAASRARKREKGIDDNEDHVTEEGLVDSPAVTPKKSEAKKDEFSDDDVDEFSDDDVDDQQGSAVVKTIADLGKAHKQHIEQRKKSGALSNTNVKIGIEWGEITSVNGQKRSSETDTQEALDNAVLFLQAWNVKLGYDVNQLVRSGGVELLRMYARDILLSFMKAEKAQESYNEIAKNLGVTNLVVEPKQFVVDIVGVTVMASCATSYTAPRATETASTASADPVDQYARDILVWLGIADKKQLSHKAVVVTDKKSGTSDTPKKKRSFADFFKKAPPKEIQLPDEEEASPDANDPNQFKSGDIAYEYNGRLYGSKQELEKEEELRNQKLVDKAKQYKDHIARSKTSDENDKDTSETLLKLRITQQKAERERRASGVKVVDRRVDGRPLESEKPQQPEEENNYTKYEKIDRIINGADIEEQIPDKRKPQSDTVDSSTSATAPNTTVPAKAAKDVRFGMSGGKVTHVNGREVPSEAKDNKDLETYALVLQAWRKNLLMNAIEYRVSKRRGGMGLSVVDTIIRMCPEAEKAQLNYNNAAAKLKVKDNVMHPIGFVVDCLTRETVTDIIAYVVRMATDSVQNDFVKKTIQTSWTKKAAIYLGLYTELEWKNLTSHFPETESEEDNTKVSLTDPGNRAVVDPASRETASRDASILQRTAFKVKDNKTKKSEAAEKEVLPKSLVDVLTKLSLMADDVKRTADSTEKVSKNTAEIHGLGDKLDKAQAPSNTNITQVNATSGQSENQQASTSKIDVAKKPFRTRV